MKNRSFQLICLIQAVAFLHCSTAATFTLTDRSEISGKILGGDDEAVYIVTPEGRKKIARSGIHEIDHPGKPAMILGGALLAMGLSLMFATEQKECREDCSFPAPYDPIALATAVSGAGFFVGGAYMWRTSRVALGTPMAQEPKTVSFGFEFQYRF